MNNCKNIKKVKTSIFFVSCKYKKQVVKTMEKEKYHVLLYYQFVPIEDHEQFAVDHLNFCKNLGLKGRILVSHNGINGTVSGTVEQTNLYMEKMHQDPRFKDIF